MCEISKECNPHNKELSRLINLIVGNAINKVYEVRDTTHLIHCNCSLMKDNIRRQSQIIQGEGKNFYILSRYILPE